MEGIVSIPYRLATNELQKGFTRQIRGQFQFLIGWLQTFQGIISIAARCPVSIPYRLATNKVCNVRRRKRVCEFQFLIGWLQTKSLHISKYVGIIVSIPYRLATNIDLSKSIWNITQGFNSLQVGYKRVFGVNGAGKTLSFNSLQVGYKRINPILHAFIKPSLVSIPYRLATNFNWKRKRYDRTGN